MTYPSVTQILSRYSDFSRVPPDVLQAAADRGTRIHQICAAIVQGLWVPEVPGYCDPYIQSFLSWLPIVNKIVAVEPELHCGKYHIKGHPDLICRLQEDKDLTLIDLKSPVQKQKSWRLQIAAYRHLALEKWPNIARVGSLRLSPEGLPPKFDEYTASWQADFNVFLSALNVYNYFRKE